MATILPFKKQNQKQVGVLFEDPKIKLERLFGSEAGYESIVQKEKYINDLCNILKGNASVLAKIQNDETGKPIAEVIEEIDSTIDFLRSIPFSSIHDNVKNLLVLTHFTDPIMTTCIAIAYAIATRSFVLIRPSTKVSRVMYKLYSILPRHSHWEMVFCDQEAVDGSLITDKRFSKIYVDAYEDIFNKIKDKSAGQDIIGQVYSNQVLVIDANSDPDMILSAFINQFFLYATRYGVRLSKILVEESVYPRAVELLAEKLSTQIMDNYSEDVQVSFSRNLPRYKVEKIRQYISDAIADGAEVSFGSITEQIDSPILLSNVNPVSNIFKHNYWEPVILLVPFKKGDFPFIVRSLDKNSIFIGTEYTVNWMKQKYSQTETSTIIGINNSPEHMWDTILKSREISPVE